MVTFGGGSEQELTGMGLRGYSGHCISILYSDGVEVTQMCATAETRRTIYFSHFTVYKLCFNKSEKN